jgi:hypothetical protein
MRSNTASLFRSVTIASPSIRHERAHERERPVCVAIGQSATSGDLFNDLVGHCKNLRRQIEAERLRGFDIDHEFQLDPNTPIGAEAGECASTEPVVGGRVAVLKLSM